MLFFQYGSVVILLTIPGLLARYVRKVRFSSFLFGRRLANQFCALALAGLCLCASMHARKNFPHSLLAFIATGKSPIPPSLAIIVTNSNLVDATEEPNAICDRLLFLSVEELPEESFIFNKFR
ncbi:hypothetical protein DSO57_1037360 [Entomophthora muscae]|uniref:Uncharacterized protein n=1 Tax=Entomophthora muscae TaxID=34485 RepID=A0ACC2TXJ5_9FUNG|nr:hypothetical protein DSO57_1037360 [Entomophthora muscae]